MSEIDNSFGYRLEKKDLNYVVSATKSNSATSPLSRYDRALIEVRISVEVPYVSLAHNTTFQINTGQFLFPTALVVKTLF